LSSVGSFREQNTRDIQLILPKIARRRRRLPDPSRVHSGVPEFWSSGVLEFWSSGVLNFTNFLIYHFFNFQNLPGSPKVSTLSFLHFLDFCYFKNSRTVLVFWSLLELFLYLWLIFSYNYQIYFFTSSLLQFLRIKITIKIKINTQHSLPFIELLD
jgi:hypothetical protein